MSEIAKASEMNSSFDRRLRRFERRIEGVFKPSEILCFARAKPTDTREALSWMGAPACSASDVRFSRGTGVGDQ